MAKVSASCRAVGAVGAVGSVGAVGAVQKVDLEVRWICWGHRHGCYLGSCIVSPTCSKDHQVKECCEALQ